MAVRNEPLAKEVIMKIILENEMERQAWPILLSAHYKWEKNHGSSIQGQMEWYFFDLFKEETDQMIAKEVETRLMENYGPQGVDVIGVTEDQYVQKGLNNYEEEGLSKEDLEQLKVELAEEYQSIIEDYEADKEFKKSDVRDELTSLYYRLFNAPENLTVEYKGEIIQQGK
ncbi:MAG: hypothetical protein A4E53_02465 [Pelotomaculum sp. PtaB.Bin104]|nr:MAG: hypothetical protein A4E53_02465 [Pelotomaculum sp. PtaB.Bin104]